MRLSILNRWFISDLSRNMDIGGFERYYLLREKFLFLKDLAISRLKNFTGTYCWMKRCEKNRMLFFFLMFFIFKTFSNCFFVTLLQIRIHVLLHVWKKSSLAQQQLPNQTHFILRTFFHWKAIDPTERYNISRDNPPMQKEFLII